MKKVLVIHGPNMNMLGIREPGIYGEGTFPELEAYIDSTAQELGFEAEFFQSNHEGEIVDRIQEAYGNADCILINPAAYTHTSVAILDALRAVGLPVAEVHLSDIAGREEFRRFSYVSLYAGKTVTGLGWEGYRVALEYLAGIGL
ncbi:MAG: type II 3-dehydroquinate dehydratase [Bacteroidaceae bacterium]|nr:type II 3-dehydroquinate dehydratase [Bacteroidaceae bacterium]